MELKTTASADNLESVKECVLCGGNHFETFFVKEGFPHVRCTECNLVFVNPRLKDHLDSQIQEGTGSMGEDSLSDSQLRRLDVAVRKLSHYRKHNRLLEIGPGKGWFLKQAKKAGWETWAVEINKLCAQKLRDIGTDFVLETSAEEANLDANFFDVIRIWDVIEHVRFPNKVLDGCFRMLRSGGIIHLATTNIRSLSFFINGPDWVYLNGSDHIFLFDPNTIKLLLSHSGFQTITIKTRSFNLRRKRYHPELEIPVTLHPLKPLRKLIDEGIRFTAYGHQLIVSAIKP